MDLSLWTKSIAAGVGAGAIASVTAATASLALTSPDVVLLNPLSVVACGLAAGALSGVLWGAFGGERGVVPFAATLAAAVAATLVLLLAADRTLDGLFTYAAPLAALASAVTGLLTPVLARRRMVLGLSPLLFAAALGAGFALTALGAPARTELAFPAVIPATPTPFVANTAIDPLPSTVVAAATVQAATLADLPSTWQVSEGSQATFTVREKLADLPLPNEAVIKTTALSGTLRRDGQSVIQVDLHQLGSDNSRRDRFIRGDLFRNISAATFTVDGTPPVPEGFVGGQTVAGTLTGTLSLGAKKTPLTLTGEARYEGGKIYFLAKSSFAWADLGLLAPNIRGIVQVEDTVNVQVLIAAVPVP